MTTLRDRTRAAAPLAEAGELIDRCRRGDQDAARLLFNAYVDRLLPVARGRISRRLARRIDAEDIVQSVFCTFFSRVKYDWFQLLDHDALLRLLVRMTMFKALKQVTYHRASRRDPHQEQAADRNDHSSYLDLPATDAAPDSTAMFLDQLDHFMGQLTLTGRQVLELRLQGYSTAEIARKLNTYDRLVRRVVERIRAAAKLEGLSA